jgi:hypothetical protein
MDDPFKKIADQAHFNIYHSSLWTNTGRRFGEMIVEECAKMCMSQADRNNLRHRFGLPVESNVKYKGPEPSNSIESQYDRELNTTRIE